MNPPISGELPENSVVAHRLRHYPPPARDRLIRLRQLIWDTAREMEGVGSVEESIKWGEPSFRVRGGSPVRINSREEGSGEVGIYFHCQTRLVETFRELYRDEFRFEGNRAILLDKDADLDSEPLRHCLQIALRYHRLKHLPLLGQ